MFLRLLEFFCGATVLWAIISQIVYPGYRGTPLFPFFRKEQKLREELSEVEQEIVEDKIETEIKIKKDTLNKKEETKTNE